MQSVTVRIVLDGDAAKAGDQQTHEGLTQAIETFESVASATVVGWDGDQTEPDSEPSPEVAGG